jgi:hypothetical protein
MRSKLLKALVDSEKFLRKPRNLAGPIGVPIDAIKGSAKIDVPYLSSLRSEPSLFDKVQGGVRMSEDFADDVPEAISHLSRHPELQAGKILMDKGLTRYLVDSGEELAKVEKGRVFVPDQTLEKIRNFEQRDALFPRIGMGNSLADIASTGDEGILKETAGRLGLLPDDLLDILMEKNRMLSKTQRGILDEDVPGFRDLIERLYKPNR